MLSTSSSPPLSGPSTRYLDEEERDAIELMVLDPEKSEFKALQERQELIFQLMQKAIEGLFSKKELVCLLENDDFACLRAAPGEHSDQGRIFTQYWTKIGKTENGSHSFPGIVKRQMSTIEGLMQYLGRIKPSAKAQANGQQLVGRLYESLQKLDEIEKRDYGSLLGEKEIDSSAIPLENQYFFARLQLFFPSFIKHAKHQLVEDVIWLLKEKQDSSCDPNDLEKLIPVETEYDQAVMSTYQSEMEEIRSSKEEDLNVQYFMDKLERDWRHEIEVFTKVASKNTLPPDSSAPL